MRPLALMIPALTVWLRPNGLPMATTQSPTSMASESPSGSGWKPVAAMRMTAMSVGASVPTTLAEKVRSSESFTLI